MAKTSKDGTLRLNKNLRSRYGDLETAEYNIWHWLRKQVQDGFSPDEIAQMANSRFDIGKRQLEAIAWKYALDRRHMIGSSMNDGDV